jgi:hypothetical protein
MSAFDPLRTFGASSHFDPLPTLVLSDWVLPP